MEFENKVVLITGAGQGIGKATALAFARNGANIAVADKNLGTASNTMNEIKVLEREAIAIEVDVTNSRQVDSMVGQTLKKFAKIDILVNNVGTSKVALLSDLAEEIWDSIMNVNAKSMFLCCKAVAEHMKRQRSGKIVNLSSMAGKTGWRYMSAYCASKFAVIGFTQAIALELAEFGINVNAVCPGVVETALTQAELVDLEKCTGTKKEDIRKEWIKMTPLGRLEKPEDVAKVVLFLCSDGAAFMTGQAINVTGGWEVH